MMMLAIVFTLIPSAVNLSISYSHSVESLKEQYVRSSQSMLELVGSDMESFYSDMISRMDFPYSVAGFLRTLTDPDEVNSYYGKKLITDTLAVTAFNNPDLESLSLYVARWDMLFMESPIDAIHRHIRFPSAELLGDLSGAEQAGYNEIFWEYTSPIKQVGILRKREEGSPLTVKRLLYNDFRYLGVFYFDIREDALTKFAKRLRTEPNELIAVLDEFGNPIFTTKPEWGESEYSSLMDIVIQGKTGSMTDFSAGGERNFVLYRKIDHFPLTLVKGIPYKVLQESAHSFVRLNVIIQIGFTIGAVLFAVLLSMWFYRPLLKLIRGINQVNQGQLGITVTPSGGTEMIKTINSFNEMSVNLKQIIDAEYESRLHMHQAKLKALQAQINPHFLFNAFQVIGSMAIDHGAEDINEMTCALAKLCRYSISPSDDLVELRDEIEHLQHFLVVQKLRFGDNLNYQIEYPEEIGGTLLPKLTLLPLVENAFIHGFRNVEHAEITIKCKVIQNRIMIQINDNGTGISSERLTQIHEWLNSPQASALDLERIGLSNVQERLIQYFGPEARLHFTTGTEAGTTVAFSIEYRWKE